MSQYGTFGDNRLPPPLQARVEAELDRSEQLLWVGQPRTRRFMLFALPIALFGIPFTAFAVFWMAMASGMLFWGAGDVRSRRAWLGLFRLLPAFRPAATGEGKRGRLRSGSSCLRRSNISCAAPRAAQTFAGFAPV